MRRKQQQNHGIIKLALSLVIATSPIVANLLFNLPSYAEPENTENTKSNTKSEFTLPKTMEQGTVINIDGSVNFVTVNQNLKDNFEKMFSGTEVKIGINGNEDAVKSVINGTVDLAALGRKLTPEEQAQGLEQLFVRREKIAIIVGAKNPFNGKLTTEEFAKIFRGEITNWSELGGEDKPIRFIDRPSNSDTRNSFQEYKIFRKGEFKTGANTTQVTDDSTAEIVKQLGDDGISYVLVNQIVKLPDVKTIKVQDFTPEQENYPFSQSFVYVYRKNSNSKVAGFLDFISSKAGQESIEAARKAEGLAIATSALQDVSTTSTTTLITTPTTIPTTIPSTEPLVNITPVDNNKTAQQPFIASSPNQDTSSIPESDKINNLPFFISKENARLVFLLPMVLVPGVGSLLYLWLAKRKKVANETNSETPQLEELELSISESKSEELELQSELESTIALSNNHSHLNGASYHQENNKTIVANPEADITYNHNHSNGNLAVIDAPIELPHTESITTETTVDTTSEITSETTSELLWDIEAPVVVVNNHYLQIPNMGQNTDSLDISNDELTISETSEIGEKDSQTTENKLAENKEEQRVNNLSELLGVQPISLNQNGSLSLSELLGVKPTIPLHSDFPDSLHTALNNIIEQPEITTQPPEVIPQNTQNTDLLMNGNTDSEKVEETGTNHEPEVIKELSNNINYNGLNTTSNTSSNPSNTIVEKVENQAITNLDFNSNNFSSNTRIIFTPRTPKWAYVSWYIDDHDQQALLNQGIRNLAIRLYDVTHLDLSYQKAPLVQQYDCEDAIYDCYVFIPQGERDYMTELGYTGKNNHWLCLARSGIVRFFSRPHTDFWLAVDTELVIHGATEQGANVTVDGQKVKLNDDGTFKLTVPFVDKLVDYHITATTPTGDKSKTIQKQFSQEQKES